MHSYRTDVWGSSGVCVSWHVFCLTSSSNRKAFDIFHTFCCACTLPQVYCAGAPLHPKIHDREPRCMGHHMKAPSRGFHTLGVQSKIFKLTKQSKTKRVKLQIFKCLLAFLICMDACSSLHSKQPRTVTNHSPRSQRLPDAPSTSSSSSSSCSQQGHNSSWHCE